MGNQKFSSSVILSHTPPTPLDLPIPLSDDGCLHLENRLMPDIYLPSTVNQSINLSQLSGWNVVFCYPMTGRPGYAIPERWLIIPGAAGCTSQVCSYRENFAVFKSNGVGIYGVSCQTLEMQHEAAIRLALTYPLLSDSMYLFSKAMKLPMLEVAGLKLIKRLTLIIKDGVVRKCFYPVFPPDKNVDEVIAWLSNTQGI